MKGGNKMIKTTITKKITVSYEKEEAEILKKAAEILQEIVDSFLDEGSSNEITNPKLDSIYISSLEDATDILDMLSDTFYLYSK